MKDTEEIKELLKRSDFYIMSELVERIATVDDKRQIDEEAIQLMAINYPEWNPDGPPQLKGKYWVKYLEDLKLKYLKKQLRKIKRDVFENLCGRLDYCKKLKNGELETEPLNLVVAICDALVSMATDFPLPIMLTAVFIVKRGLLTEFCGCEK